MEGDDLILCQITSQSVRDNLAIPLTDQDFKSGSTTVRLNIELDASGKLIGVEVFKASSLFKDVIHLMGKRLQAA